MQFKVRIDFRRGPSFETTLDANDKSDAEVKAMMTAKENGFDGIPKKVIVRPA